MSVTIALAGNPNCGKTTMFNALTGANQYVGNWPGVTVEKKEGKLKNQKDVTVTDLPGIYSLSPYTLEEVVSRDYLLKEKPDVIISSGAAVAVPFFYLGKLMGKKLIYIEVFDRIDKPTVTGKMVYPITDRFIVQWEEMKKVYPKAINLGSIF